VIGSNRTTNEENYLLQKFARTVLTTNNIDHKRTTGYAEFAAALAGKAGKTAGLGDIAGACAILLVGGNPTEEHPLLAWTIRTNVRLNRARLYVANSKSIKLERQAKATQGLPPGGYKDLPALLDMGNTDLSKAVLAEKSLVVILGEECRGEAMANLIAWGLKRGNVRFALLGDYSNSRGAADMGLSPDLLPGYVPVAAPSGFAEYAGMPAAPGKTLQQMVAETDKGELGALLVVGANPLVKLAAATDRLKGTFLVVQDLFLTETAALADVVLPAASLYEKSGTVTNTYGDVQLVKKAADRAGVKPDFEILVRLADAMGADVKALVPFGKGGVTADLGQSRGAQAGEADQHSVWLAANNLEPRLSPFDPLAVLDEIARLVPGYLLDRVNLFGGNAVQTEPGAGPGFVPVSALTLSPAHDTLFTSGTLGRYSSALKELEKHQTQEVAGAAAD
jgi:NADH-quinone oxidoreductase subunit G